MRVLVTGTSGHVGGAVAAALTAEGYEVVGLSRRATGPDGLADHAALDLAAPDFFEQAAALAPCEAIVHAAARIHPDLDDVAVSQANAVGTHQVVRLARAWAVRQLVYLSSVPIIGVPRVLPITEEHPTDPPTAYHASKLYGELLMALAARDGLAAASLRLTSPVGPGMPEGRIFSLFVQRAVQGLPLALFGQGSRRQNYVDVRDVAAVVGRCLKQPVTGLYHVAGAAAISNLDLARRCIDVLGSASGITFLDRDDPEEGRAWEVSIEKARRAFGYVPACSIDDSIEAVAQDYAHRAHQ